MNNETAYFLAGVRYQRVGCQCAFVRVYNTRVKEPMLRTKCMICAGTSVVPCHMGELT